MNQTQAIDRLFKALEIIRENASEDVSIWLEEGLVNYIQGEDLETALGLSSSGRGQERLITKWKRNSRDLSLKEAFKHVEGNNSWQRAEELNKQIKRYEITAWRFDLNMKEPPVTYSQLRKHIFYALKSGCSIPSSTRQIWEIVTFK